MANFKRRQMEGRTLGEHRRHLGELLCERKSFYSRRAITVSRSGQFRSAGKIRKPQANKLSIEVEAIIC